MKYTSNFKPNLILQPTLFKDSADVSNSIETKKNKNTLVKHLTKYIKYEDSLFKATSMCFIYTTLKTLVKLNEFSKKSELSIADNQVMVNKLTFFSMKTKTSPYNIFIAPNRYKKRL